MPIRLVGHIAYIGSWIGPQAILTLLSASRQISITNLIPMILQVFLPTLLKSNVLRYISIVTLQSIKKFADFSEKNATFFSFVDYN